MRNLTDQEIVEKLLARDPVVTEWFYFVKCRPLFLSLMKKLFDYPIEYKEFVNEVVLFLMENDEHRLRSFDFQSTITHWLRRCLVRHFIRNGKVMIDDTSKEPPYPYEGSEVDVVSQINAKLDLDILLTILGDTVWEMRCSKMRPGGYPLFFPMERIRHTGSAGMNLQSLLSGLGKKPFWKD